MPDDHARLEVVVHPRNAEAHGHEGGLLGAADHEPGVDPIAETGRIGDPPGIRLQVVELTARDLGEVERKVGPRGITL